MTNKELIALTIKQKLLNKDLSIKFDVIDKYIRQYENKLTSTQKHIQKVFGEVKEQFLNANNIKQVTGFQPLYDLLKHKVDTKAMGQYMSKFYLAILE